MDVLTNTGGFSTLVAVSLSVSAVLQPGEPSLFTFVAASLSLSLSRALSLSLVLSLLQLHDVSVRPLDPHASAQQLISRD